MAAPLISVVIPTFDRGDVLRLVLDAYELQEPAELDFELIVVDDGSTDGTAELLASRSSERYRLRVERQPNSGPAAARNRAIALVEGELVLFTGDDIEPEPDLLQQHVAGHREHSDSCVAILGLTGWPEGVPLSATMSHIDGPGAQQFSYHYFRDGAEYDFRHFYTSNVSLQRELLGLEPEGFCTDFPAAAFEDAEFAYRLSRHGMRIVYRAAAVASHHHAYDARSFFRRQLRCGEMATILCDKQPALKKWLGIGELQWRRLGLLAAEAEQRRHVEGVERDLERWEERALALVGFFDRGGASAVETVLHPLFEYGYLSGLASGLYPDSDARRIRSAEFLRLLPSAVREFERQASSDGIPVPRSDLEAIAALGRAADEDLIS